ncbi:cell division protein PerM [Catellatospora tritici]|uniref:cell division protein PerM n=1 Tax=Catellatospora tritici TaxID=2851566 RepID=UPI001C2DE99C|nr:DUF6350 family protein [Catellatospora tritici]MBV1849690.1 hypothetical protein [Catellatospora tritici]
MPTQLRPAVPGGRVPDGDSASGAVNGSSPRGVDAPRADAPATEHDGPVTGAAPRAATPEAATGQDTPGTGAAPRDGEPEAEAAAAEEAAVLLESARPDDPLPARDPEHDVTTHDTVLLTPGHLATRETVLLPPRDDLAYRETVLLSRGRPTGSLRPRGAPLPIAALVNTVWAALQTLLPLLLLTVGARSVEGPVELGLSARVALSGWLLGHGVPLTGPLNEHLATLDLPPLLLTAVALWRLSRAGVHTVRALGAQGSGSIRHAALAAGAVGVVYCGLGVGAAALVDGPGILVTPWRAAISFAVLGLAAAGLGAARSGGVVRRLARLTPLLLRDGIRVGVVATLLIMGVGAGAVGLAVAVNGAEASHRLAEFPGGVLGQVGAVLLCLAYGPNLSVWAASYLLGPGFEAGTLPRTGLPVFAGVPQAPLRGVGWLLTVLPLLGGALAVVLLAHRRLRPRRTRQGDVVKPRPNWPRMAGSAAVGGVVAGLLCAAVGYASGGVLRTTTGSLRFGPAIWPMAGMAALVVTLGGLLAVAGVWAFAARPGAKRTESVV